jgi:hypothetical protein
MIKALAAASLLLAVGCTARAKSEPLPEDAKIQALVAKLAPAIPCDPPKDSLKDQSVRAECDGGRAFVTVYPDATGLRLEFVRLADISVGNDYLVGDDATWFAGANDLDGLERMRGYLGGRVQHVSPTPMG